MPKDGLVGVLSATPKKAKSGSSYLGMPPVELRRTNETGDRSRTYDPPWRAEGRPRAGREPPPAARHLHGRARVC
ncbi:hypothetical protein GCM10020219_052700 [Nonomuraea dietziae]